DTYQTVPTRLERIVPHRPPPVETVLDHTDLMTGCDQGEFHHARPTGVERQALAGARGDAPTQRNGGPGNLLHASPSNSAAARNSITCRGCCKSLAPPKPECVPVKCRAWIGSCCQ